MKAFIFEAFTGEKSFGSTMPPVEVVVVKNAENKAAARVLAEKAIDKGLRIVMSGQTYKNEREAIAQACRYCTLINDNKKADDRKTVWFVVEQ